jgi:putative membrane protein
MMWHHGLSNYGGLGWGLILMVGLVKLVILVAIIALAVVLVRRLSQPNQSAGHHSDDAVAVLKARYARGEITREQFIQMKEDLK